MENAKKVSDELSATGQITPEQLKQAEAAGFKSVLNLRSPAESGYSNDEQQQVEAAGLKYANVSVSATEANQVSIQSAIQEIENLPKPVLVHCAAGARATGIALIAAAIKAGSTYEQIVEKAQQLGLNLDQPHLKQFLLENYTAKQAEKG